MTIDTIIKKYGMHDLDVSVLNASGEATIYAYCQKLHEDGTLAANHYLEVKGRFVAKKIDVDDSNDIYIHVATIEKTASETYEIFGVGGSIEFKVCGDLSVKELTESDFNALSHS